MDWWHDGVWPGRKIRLLCFKGDHLLKITASGRSLDRIAILIAGTASETTKPDVAIRLFCCLGYRCKMLMKKIAIFFEMHRSRGTYSKN